MKRIKHDIFVSYATVNNHDKWVDDLSSKLKSLLDEFAGTKGTTQIWMDHELRGSEPFDEQLTKEVQSSELLLIVMSKEWLKSEWCKRALQLFHESWEENISGRVFLIHKERTNHETWPSQISGWSKNKFVFYDEQNGLCVPTFSFRTNACYDLTGEIEKKLSLSQADAHLPDALNLDELFRNYSQGLLSWPTSLNNTSWMA